MNHNLHSSLQLQDFVARLVVVLVASGLAGVIQIFMQRGLICKKLRHELLLHRHARVVHQPSALRNDWLSFTGQPYNNEMSDFLFNARFRSEKSEPPLPVACGDCFNDEISEARILELCFDSLQILGESCSFKDQKHPLKC